MRVSSELASARCQTSSMTAFICRAGGSFDSNVAIAKIADPLDYARRAIRVMLNLCQGGELLIGIDLQGIALLVGRTDH